MKKIIKCANLSSYSDVVMDKINTTTMDVKNDIMTFISNDEKHVYKLFLSNTKNYDIDNIITTNDIDQKMSRFLFPEEIHVLNNELKSYKTKNMKGEPLYDEGAINYAALSKVDLKQLFNSIKELREEIKLLSDNNILISNLKENLIVNENGLYVSDTFKYRKNIIYVENIVYGNQSLYGDVYIQNKKMLDEVLREISLLSFEQPRTRAKK